ncbi:hypothetical protein FE391_35515 [Nonomuraea sp. KC401]|uniref:hypothetical protein n=1 Tax=unclassified Nonomuraea TaxID=2593643 RepID=UPI0010FD7496|nr:MULTISPECIES: hypothetical protein [unclassified Nonomuraea]NBF00095.1 hypothetical protein [Nonomuraea sp. K271]TLF58973.1 hypothetical protein FE391_35515 [Nonomuraea sp. KC401]
MTRPDRPDPDPGTWLLNKIDAREQAVTCQIEQAQAEIDVLTARLAELTETIEHLRITRKTLLSLAHEPGTEPVAAPLALPENPAYQQILTVFADLGRSLRARELCEALDLPLAHNSIQNVRAKLKRLVNHGVLVENEPGLFAQPLP